MLALDKGLKAPHCKKTSLLQNVMQGLKQATVNAVMKLRVP
jgi:hypothetical protein